MRKAFSPQRRLDCPSIVNVTLNVECRHELIPILKALQHIYDRPEVRDAILNLVAGDVKGEARDDCGRTGLDYWQVLVLAAVRLGCGLDYDQLQDLAEQHRALRQMMGLGDWDEDTSFNWRRIRDNICLLRPETIEAVNQQIVTAGHALAPDAAKKVRADSFIVETNIHWPSEGTLIRDGVRKIIELCVLLATRYGLTGWRQSDHLLKKVQRLSRRIERLAARKRPGYQEHLKEAYRHLLRFSGQVLSRAEGLIADIERQGTTDMSTLACVADLQVFMERTEQVRGTARRRVLHGEQVPNADKLFSIFEPHTQLYKRGKAGEPVQFGRLVLVYEDEAGFVIHSHVLPRDAGDEDVAVEQTRIAQKKMGGRIEQVSFDRGFHTPQNQIALAKIVTHPCLPKPGVKQAAQQAANATVEFREARQRHPGVESAIGALQRGNDLERCRDRSEVGFQRYVALGILGRNLHVLGKLLIAQQSPDSHAAHSDRQRAA
jgi:IS5 family transposase